MPTISAEAVPHAPAPAHTGAPLLAQFFIPAAASLQERRPRTLKQGDTFAVFDHNGDALAGPGSPEGIYHRDTRYLSHFYLTIGGARPILLSSTLRDDNAVLTCDLTNPDIFDQPGQQSLEHDLIHIRRTRFLWGAMCFERWAIRNFDSEARRISMELSFDADFYDLFEVRGTQRLKRGRRHEAVHDHASVVLSYTGLDGKLRQTRLRFDPAPTSLTASKAVFEFELQPNSTHRIYLEVGCDIDNSGVSQRPAFLVALREARRSLRQLASRAASIASSNETFNEALRRSISDLYMLITKTPHGSYPYAGIPWFSTVFGRDALITALQVLWIDPSIARGVLCYLAAHQADTIDPAADAEPGKILHEVRHGEMAELGEVPFRRYYGSVDSTPLFVILAGAYLDRTGDVDTIRNIWPQIELALHWIETYGDLDRDGFVEYGRMTEKGLLNQGWKDSHDAVFHADGTLAKGPIAIVEVQAYVYGAWCAAARMAQILGDVKRATRWEIAADGLRRRFDEAFFDRELGTYILALDGSKKPCRVKASNAGHALFTGIAYPKRAEAVVRTLMSSSFFSGWGIRTVGTGESRYNPMSYHNGSVWPHDNALIGAGFARYGFRRETARIFEGLYAASTYIDLRRLPELFCGFSRQRAQGPTFYPVACSPQAWAATAPISLIQSSLGLGFATAGSQLHFERPTLPGFIGELVLRRLAVGEGSADILFRRAGDEVVVNVLRREGKIQIATTN